MKFCEEKNLTVVALGLKQDLLEQQTAQKQSQKELQERAL